MGVVDDSNQHSLKQEENAIASLAGGILGNGYQCGMLWGAALAAGAQVYKLLGPGPQAEAEALALTQKLVESFVARNKHVNCSEITEINWKASMKNQAIKFILKGGPIACFSMSASYARIAYNDIASGLPENSYAALEGPVSCAALFAQKAGASNLHSTMAAGFAGGIGLSGSGCGVLGAAIWLAGMNNGSSSTGMMNFEDPKMLAIVETFLESADYEFECAKITGRQFETVAEHAKFIHEGGCAKIIEALAA